MSHTPYFPREEYEARLNKIRWLIEEQHLDAILVSSPENIFYLTGLDHQGFFVLHLLIVPREGELTLITRQMERETINEQIPHIHFRGHLDDEDPGLFSCRVIRDMGLGKARLGLEKSGGLLSFGIGESLLRGLPAAEWEDISGQIDELRLIKSPLELDYIREAASVTDAMMQAAISTAGAGVNEREVAAAVYQAMALTGGDYPGFHPFIRTTDRLGEEHTTWQDKVLTNGDALFLEMAGCVRRYHAPMGRLIFIGSAPSGTQEAAALCLEAFDAVTRAIRPGTIAGEAYQAWQDVVDRAGLQHYRRHHCGYLVGVGFPPSWTGGNTVSGLRAGDPRPLKPGMAFHLMSWLMDTGMPGNYFLSNTAILTDGGCQVLTRTPATVQVT